MKLLKGALVAAVAVAAAGEAQAFWPFTSGAMDLDEVSCVALPDEWFSNGVMANDWNWGVAGAIDLTNAVTRMTGKACPIVQESKLAADATNVIYLGPTEMAKKTMDGLKGYTTQEFRIKTEKGRIILGAATTCSASYVVTEFMQRFLDYWFVTIRGNDPLPEDCNPTIEIADIRMKPAITSRFLEHTMYDGGRFPKTKRFWEHYNRRLRLEQCVIEQANRLSMACGCDCHSSFKYCPPQKYFKDHPEYYAMHPNGKRDYQPTGQLCMSNPNVYNIVFESLKGFIEKDRKGKKPGEWPLIYDFTQQDNTSWLCFCPECKKIIAKYNRVPGGFYDGGDAGLQLEFVNRLARDIRKIYPDVWIRTFAYVSSERVPKEGTIVPEDNVMIWLCDLYGDSNHEYPLLSPRNKHRSDLIRAWSKLAKRLELWDYMLYGNGIPEVNVDANAEDAKFYRDIGLDRIFFEDHATGVNLACFWELNNFVRGQCYFNPDVDLEMLVEKFCRVYGKGAKKMVKAINFYRGVMKKDMPTKFKMVKGYPHFTEKMAYARHSEEDMLEFAEMLQDAYDAAEPGEGRGRISQALNATWGNLRERYSHDCGDAAAKKRAAALDEVKKHGEEYVTTAAWIEPKYVEGHVKWLRGLKDQAPLRYDDMPEELKKYSQDEIVCVSPRKVGGEDQAVGYRDPEAYGKWAIVLDMNKTGLKKEYGCGIYDRKTTEWTKFNLKCVEPNDEKYHWYHLGQAHIGPDAIFYCPEENWSISIYLSEFFVNSDGLIDNNWYDFWVSVKFAGPDYVPGSKKPNGLYVNRMIMRRTPKEQAQ